MGWFSNKNEGGILNVIRCDETDYLIWKWTPGTEEGRRENEIRFGSSLRVKEGEVAIFVYKQKNGNMQDYIEGPLDETLKTANFPVLSSIMGAAFGGHSPFQAEVYFINLAGIVRLPFFIPKANITDPRLDDYAVPATVKGSLIFNILDYKGFIRLNKLNNFNIDDFSLQVKDPIIANISSLIGRSPKNCNFPIFKIDQYLPELNKMLEDNLRERIQQEYGINIKQVNVSVIDLDKEDENYIRVDKILKGRAEMIADKQAEITADMIEDNRDHDYDLRQRMNEEAQRMQKLKTEQEFINVHQLNIQGDVAKTAAESLGKMGSGGEFGGGAFNPAAMMTGMVMGGAVGNSMSTMMTGMTQGINTPQPPPPKGSIAQYHIANSGQQQGPFTLDQLKELLVNKTITDNTYIWKPGMPQWELIKNFSEVSSIFINIPPPPPL